jgi:Exostosin family
LPFDWSHVAAHPQALAIAKQLADEAMLQGIPLAVFYLDDATTSVDLENALVFRTSINRSTRRPNEVVIPAWSEDFVEHYCHGQMQLRSQSSQPIVGYCGYQSLVKPKNNLTNSLRLQLGAIPGAAHVAAKVGVELVKHPLTWLYGSRIRSQALHILSKSKDINCNFIIRDTLHHTEKLTLLQRQQFVENMLGSDYILCTRGGGNFSYRFYETLSCGRIPVFVNTDCELPFERWIDWKRYCVWVEEEDLPYLGKRIREFHQRLTPQQFQDLQMECRNLWLEWLSPQGFLANFHRYFQPL